MRLRDVAGEGGKSWEGSFISREDHYAGGIVSLHYVRYVNGALSVLQQCIEGANLTECIMQLITPY